MNNLYRFGDMLNGLLGKLNTEDMVLLAIILLFIFENKCDQTFIIILIIIFITGIEQGLLPS